MNIEHSAPEPAQPYSRIIFSGFPYTKVANEEERENCLPQTNPQCQAAAKKMTPRATALRNTAGDPAQQEASEKRQTENLAQQEAPNSVE